jgi:acetyl esterase/lipase
MQPISIDYGTPKPPGRLRQLLKYAFRGVVALLIFALFSFGAARIWLTRGAGGPGQPPAGYSSMNQVYAAIMIGALPLIDRQPSVPPELTLKEGLSYARSSDIDLKLDLYLPAGASRDQRRPLFVLIHGGGWKSGDRADYRPHAVRVAKAGYVVASLSYRLSGVAKFPAAARDVNTALQFLANRADEFGIDPNRFVLMGGSAGGHLAMLAGYSKAPRLKSEKAEPGDVNYKIASIFNFYGPCDLTSDFARDVDVVKSFIGKNFSEGAEVYREASPLFDITPEAPPTLIVHGTLDDIVPVEQSDQLAEKLRAAGVPVRYERISGWPHTMDLAAPMFEYLSTVILEELRRAVGRVDIAG